jgi:bilirubin oxidase
LEGATEVWEVHNTTEDAHAIHIHQVQFQIVNREDSGGTQREPELSETGFKDTVIASPGEITRVRAKFDIQAPSCGIAICWTRKTTK